MSLKSFKIHTNEFENTLRGSGKFLFGCFFNQNYEETLHHSLNQRIVASKGQSKDDKDGTIHVIASMKGPKLP